MNNFSLHSHIFSVIQQKTGEFFLRHINELEDQTLANLVRDTINKWNGEFIFFSIFYQLKSIS